jgi:hypothetical protein
MSDNAVTEPCCMGTAVYRDKSRCTCAASTTELDIAAIEARIAQGDVMFDVIQVEPLLAEVKRLRAELKERNAAA